MTEVVGQAGETGILFPEEALEALNVLRSNVVATQSATWSNLVYPLVAILNAAGIKQIDSTEVQQRHHLAAYGGAGGYPGNELREPITGWCEPISLLLLLAEATRRLLNDPSGENREHAERTLERAKAVFA